MFFDIVTLIIVICSFSINFYTGCSKTRIFFFLTFLYESTFSFDFRYNYFFIFVGKVVECRPGSLQKRRLYKYTAALDSYRNNLHRRDMVKVIDGPHSGFAGEIKHLYRYIFLFSKLCNNNHVDHIIL